MLLKGVDSDPVQNYLVLIHTQAKPKQPEACSVSSSTDRRGQVSDSDRWGALGAIGRKDQQSFRRENMLANMLAISCNRKCDKSIRFGGLGGSAAGCRA